MTTTRDPDAILAAWLEEGPVGLPEATRRVIAVTTRTTEQKRRSSWAPWRTVPMPTFARVVVVAIAVFAIAGGAVYFLRPDQGVGVPAPTAQPTIAPTPTPEPSSAQAEATVPTDWIPYASSRFAYTVDHPADWIVIPATEDWTSIYPPDQGGPRMDYIGAKPFGSRVYVSSVPLKPGRDAGGWISSFDSQTAASCDPTSDRHGITIDGVTMRQEDQFCGQTVHIIEVLGAHNGRFYDIDLVSEAPITPTDRATFDRFLASFRFGG